MRRALVLSALAFAACGGPAPNTPASRAATPAEIGRGQQLYTRYCALCHGKDAVGYVADNASQLSNPTFLATATDELLRVAIVRGRPGTPMSAFGSEHGGPLADSDASAIVAYLRSLSDAPALDVHQSGVDGEPESGAAVFREHCSSCHGQRGQGKTALSLNNPIFLATASPGFIRYAIEHGRPGTKMRAFGDELSGQELDDVTSFVKSWARQPPAAASAPGALPALSSVLQNPSGPRPTFRPREGRFVPAVEVEQALRARARIVILDARPISDWHLGHIPGAYPTPFYADLDEIAAALPRDGTWIIAYCACPHAASGKVVDGLRERGFSNTAVIDEGIVVWRERGYPMQATAAAPATK